MKSDKSILNSQFVLRRLSFTSRFVCLCFRDKVEWSLFCRANGRVVCSLPQAHRVELRVATGPQRAIHDTFLLQTRVWRSVSLCESRLNPAPSFARLCRPPLCKLHSRSAFCSD